MGYGNFKGVPVWVVKNSWSSGFGQFGYFYIERGSDALCIERYLAAVLPEGFSENEQVFTARRGNVNVYANLLKRGAGGLDQDSGEFRFWRQIGYLTVLEGAVLFLLAVVAGSVSGISKRKRE